MNGFVSLKQVEKVKAEVGSELTPVNIFSGAVITASPDAPATLDAEGVLWLPPGIHLVMFSAGVRWRTAEAVTVAVILGHDARYRGPRCLLEHERGALELLGTVRDAASYLKIEKTEWDRVARRPANCWGAVIVPEGPPVACEVWASAFVERHDPATITVSDAELVVIKLATKGQP